MNDRDIMQQALEALTAYDGTNGASQRKRVLAALRERLAQPNEFQPDWDAMAVMVAEQQRMAKRIAELEAQPEQEPVAWEDVLGAIARGWTHDDNKHKPMDVQLAVAIAKEIQDMVTAPPQRKPLTDEEIERACVPLGAAMLSFTEVARAIEAAHGIKEEGMSAEQKRFEEWWDAKDDIPNNGPWTHDTPIQFAWAAWQAALPQPEQEPVSGQYRFPGVAWSQCDPAHVRIVLDNPHEWKGYEVRYLYTTPPAAQPATEKSSAVSPEQEPVAYLCENAVGHKYFRWKKPSSTYKPIALYTAPPQRTWVGLTDVELTDMHAMLMVKLRGCYETKDLYKAIEQRIKEKNT